MIGRRNHQAAVDALYPNVYAPPSPNVPSASIGGYQSYIPNRNSYVYKISERYEQNDMPYWVSNLSHRFDGTINTGILYSKQMVTDLRNSFDHLFQSQIRVGLMIKGPEGVGKSHTLVNLTEDLTQECRNKNCCPYHITFIPDCKKWNSAEDFIEAVLASFKINASLEPQVATNFDEVMQLVEILDGMLAMKNMRWIFIFDQFDALFRRPEHQRLFDIYKFPFPFNLITTVRKPGRILSVICASASIKRSHGYYHEGFQEYKHPIQMGLNEVAKLCGATFVNNPRLRITGRIPLQVLDRIYGASIVNNPQLKSTGRIPLQIARLVELGENYASDEKDSIARSVRRLMKQLQKNQKRYRDFHESVIASLLKARTRTCIYDRKYFNWNGYNHEPLYPLVEEVYFHIFWDDIMTNVSENERSLLYICANPAVGHLLTYVYENKRRTLYVCANPTVDQDSIDRYFELIVIQRCQSHAFTIPSEQEGDQLVIIPNFCSRFSGRALPEIGTNTNDGMFIPEDPYFPAIDLVWKIGNRVIGVQVYISIHKDIVTAFEDLCREAGWHERFDTVELWYLGPTAEAREQVAAICVMGERKCVPTHTSGTGWTINVSAKTIQNVSCLQDLVWPVDRAI